MRSVWSRVASGSITVVSPAVLRPASRMALFTCAEATGRRYSIGTISSVPTMASGRRPPSRPSKRAPMRDSGSITRCIGRRRSEASPVMTLVKGWLARMPASRRAEVPELPSSSTSAGSRPPPTPKPRTRHRPAVALMRDLGAQRPQRRGGGQHVLALQQAAHRGLAQRQGAEHQGAMGDRFVARRAHPALQAADRTGDKLGRMGSQRQDSLPERRRKCDAGALVPWRNLVLTG